VCYCIPFVLYCRRFYFDVLSTLPDVLPGARIVLLNWRFVSQPGRFLWQYCDKTYISVNVLSIILQLFVYETCAFVYETCTFVYVLSNINLILLTTFYETFTICYVSYGIVDVFKFTFRQLYRTNLPGARFVRFFWRFVYVIFSSVVVVGNMPAFSKVLAYLQTHPLEKITYTKRQKKRTKRVPGKFVRYSWRNVNLKTSTIPYET
jgi:hypothetical protein